MVYCRICFKIMKSITNTHLATHGTTIKEYIEEFDLKPEDWMGPDYMMNVEKMVEKTISLGEAGRHWTQIDTAKKNSELRKEEARLKNE